MTRAWKYGLLLLGSISLHAFADDNTPTDEVIKQQFAAQSGGEMRLDALTLRPLEAVGNRATYMVEGDMAATDNLYSMVGMAGDYLFYERTWTKGQPVKFSAMMTAVGTKASSWKTEFFSMQMAAKNAGRPFKEKEDLSKVLVVNDSSFMAQFAKIDAQFAASKALVQKQQREYEALKQKVAALDEKINLTWGTDANGKALGRSGAQKALFQSLYDLDRKNDMAKFENQYYINVYEPALVACQKKAVCDATPIRAARDLAMSNQRAEYQRQHNQMRQKITAAIAEKEEKIAPLQKEREPLFGKMTGLSFDNSALEHDGKIWQEETAKLRKEGIIP